MTRTSASRFVRPLAACVVAAMAAFTTSGCSRPSEPSPPATSSSADPLDPAEVVSTPAPARPRLVATEAAPVDDGATAPRDSEPSTSASADGAGADTTTPAPTTTPPTTPLSLADTAQDADDPALQLRSDLSPQQLVDFLSAADKDMQLIFQGRAGMATQEEALAEMKRIIRAKLEASRRLVSHSDSTDAQRATGKRGELQALSHLASQGDLQAAEELEEVAQAGLESDDAKVRSDSRLVLVGFAIESLQNGDTSAAGKLVDLVDQYAASDESPDVPAMMVMGQAREILSRYGHDAEAAQVREKILAAFGNSPQAEVAMMAAKLAGDSQLDEIDRLRTEAIEAESVSADEWTTAAKQLLAKSKGIDAVQFLARAALEFEGSGNEALAEATYDVLRESFPEASDARGREAAVALKARQARRQMIGTDFQSKLPPLDGEPIEWSDYTGKIVLLPFWTVDYPASLQLLPTIQRLRKKYPDQIAILGVNLDNATSQRDSNSREQLGFPSLRSETDPTAPIPNPLANQFGMVSMPFLVILDRDGKVADICFTEQRLQQKIGEMLSE